MRAVNTPMGISWGSTARVMVSAHKRSVAPASMEIGNSFLLSGPVRKRIIWGTSRPTNPIIPDMATLTAASMEPVINRIKVTFFRSTPKLMADRSPMEIRFKSLAKKTDTQCP